VAIDKCNNSTLEDFIFNIPAKVSDNESRFAKLPLPMNMSLLFVVYLPKNGHE
jgi:hypothetical protein